MRSTLSTLGVIAQIALRNLFASPWKTLIVGGIIGFGAMLVVLGTSLLDSVDHSMSRSIIGSVAGNIQIYSKNSKDELDVMGGFSLDSAALEPLTDFAAVEKVVLEVPNVKAIVPMGIDGALVLSGNTVDQALARLRTSVGARQRGEGSPEIDAAYTAQKDHVRQILSVLGGDIEKIKQLAADGVTVNEDLELVRQVSSPSFWQSFDDDPFSHLELLENRVAPLATDADLLFLRYVGTDPAEFARSFDRMTIVEGEPIPEGKRGFMFSKYVYEEQVKLKTARGLDKIKDARDNRKVKIDEDEELRRLVREGPRQVKELLLQLDAPKTELFRRKLQAELGTKEEKVGTLLEQFLTLTDDSFERRYEFFYKELAPSLELYRVRIGDTLTIKAFTRSGYVQSANLKVYGTFAFKGLEKSPQAGALNLMDIVSFRELYGFMTADRQAEIASIRAEAGAKDVSRENAEAELFGAGPGAVVQGAVVPAEYDVSKTLQGLAGVRRTSSVSDAAYDPAQLQRGVILNAAV
ncbi:MAG: ABC transporter permease, partial [Polyangiaceae bacterium]